MCHSVYRITVNIIAIKHVYKGTLDRHIYPIYIANKEKVVLVFLYQSQTIWMLFGADDKLFTLTQLSNYVIHYTTLIQLTTVGIFITLS